MKVRQKQRGGRGNMEARKSTRKLHLEGRTERPETYLGRMEHAAYARTSGHAPARIAFAAIMIDAGFFVRDRGEDTHPSRLHDMHVYFWVVF